MVSKNRTVSYEKSLARRLYLTKKQRNDHTRRKCKRRRTRQDCVNTYSKVSLKRVCTWEKGGKRRRALCKRRSMRRKKRKNSK